MYNRLVDHLQSNNLFDEQQHGFRKGKSVNSALLEFSEHIIDSIDRGDKVVGIFMDLSKAFDSISHKILLSKLKKLGISELSLKWFESYLSNRRQYVEIRSTKDNLIRKCKSEILTVKYGVPQGSILGPLLFLCYVQGMPTLLKYINNAKSQLILYADDSNLITSSRSYKDLELICNELLKLFQKYFVRNSLFLNVDKTNQMIFSTLQNKDRPQMNIIIDQNKISEINVIKFLGLEVDNHLTWNFHIQKVANKISTGLYVLRRMSFLCSLNTLKSIYYAHINSHLTYGLAIYGGTTKNNLDLILRLQKQAIRIMLKLDPKTSVKEYFSQLDILTVYDRYIFECILCVKNQFHNLNFRSTYHTHNTRNRNEINLTQHNLSFFTKKATYMGSKFFNHLPYTLKENVDKKCFRKQLKEYLVKKNCYSIEEFFSTL
uniref:Reverse transcriptase domain-containing protein n=1 Tax=Graphocephala atropunctata TaxID=36148 RepID=A0A1B6LNH8_9HEMI